jgi:DNA-directed RNA polymerase subunit beta'
VKYRGLRLVQTADGANIVLNKTGTIQILDERDKELETYNIVVGSFLHVGDGEKIEKGAVLAQWDPYNIPVLSEKGGTLVSRT